jgi:hypothetical protein
MKTTASITAQAARVLLAAGASLLISSCSMPPRQAWDMIQRDGLFNYWSYSAGHQPVYGRPSPPLQRSATQSLAYRPSTLSYPSSQPSTLSNRYYAPATSPAPAPQIAQPSYRPKSSSSSTKRSKPRVVASRDDDQPRVRIPVEPPAPVSSYSKPSVASSPKPSSGSTSAAAAAPKKDLPFGTVVPGRSNMVNSPYAQKSQLVDVAGMSAGQTVKCPYSGKLFKVPPTQQAANKVESKLESPTLKSPEKAADKPKSENKPKAEPKSEPKEEPKAETKP